MRAHHALIAAPLLTLAVAGCGTTTRSAPGRTVPTAGTVEIAMADNTFQPAVITVRRGQTLTLRFRNTGRVKHEAVIGDAATQDHHETGMGSEPMDHGDAGGTPDPDASSAITVEPGHTGDLTHTFAESGTLLIGCHEPGHWNAGMKATIATS